jgi:hypothetical protein
VWVVETAYRHPVNRAGGPISKAVQGFVVNMIRSTICLHVIMVLLVAEPSSRGVSHRILRLVRA